MAKKSDSPKQKKAVEGRLVRRITKVKYNGTRCRVEWEVPAFKPDDDPDLGYVDSAQQPIEALGLRLAELKPHFLKLIEIPPDAREKWSANLRITSISFNWKPAKDDAESSSGKRMIMGCVITGVKGFQDGAKPAAINTPHFTEEPYIANDPGAKDLCLDAACAETLHEVLEIADR